MHSLRDPRLLTEKSTLREQAPAAALVDEADPVPSFFRCRSCVACTGTPNDCSTQSGCAAPGCTMTSSCGGGYIDCQIFDAEQSDCEAVPGCTFNTVDNACTGGPNCGDLDAAACTVASVACTLSTGCTGMPTPCSMLSVAQCAATAGCRLQ